MDVGAESIVGRVLFCTEGQVERRGEERRGTSDDYLTAVLGLEESLFIRGLYLLPPFILLGETVNRNFILIDVQFKLELKTFIRLQRGLVRTFRLTFLVSPANTVGTVKHCHEARPFNVAVLFALALFCWERQE